MKLVMDNAADFKKCIEAIAVLIDEAEFIANENGLFLKATDPSQIAMVDFELPKSSFREFNVSNELTIGLDMDYFKKILGRAKTDDLLELELEEGATTLNVIFKGRSKRKFQIPLIDISKGQLPNPKIEFEASIKMHAAVLQEALKDAELIASHVTLGANENCFYVSASGSKGTMHNETSKDEPDILDFNVSAPCKAMFPLDYLKDMLKPPRKEDVITVHLRTDAPVKIDYIISDARVSYYLAPRIETE